MQYIFDFKNFLDANIWFVFIITTSIAIFALYRAFDFHSKWSIALFDVKRLEKTKEQQRGADNALTVGILSREVANELILRNEVEFSKKFQKLYQKWHGLSKLNEEVKRISLDGFTSKYPFFNDFDLIATKTHILHADAYSSYSDSDLWELYESLRLYDALSSELDEYWVGSTIYQGENKDIKQYCKRVSDTILLHHLHKAKYEWDIIKFYSSEDENSSEEWQYETKNYKFKELPWQNPFECKRIGIYIKSINRYGLLSSSCPEDVIYTHFYASDKKFKEEVRIDNIPLLRISPLEESDIGDIESWKYPE